jgi:hypothetical protein
VNEFLLTRGLQASSSIFVLAIALGILFVTVPETKESLMA